MNKDRNRKGKNRNQRSKIKDGYSNSVLEHEYHMADDHEEVLNVRILPARPIDAEREYAVDKGQLKRQNSVHMAKTYCEEDWYVGTCTRADAEHALHLVNKDGAFLVRDCSINSNSEPLVLAMYHGKKVYNVKIRFIESTSKYALGRGHRSNDMFDSVAEIIKFHSIFPVILISGRNMPGSKCPENCVLTCPVTRSDVEQLLQ
ncbi:Cytokine-dependent hematopoietic cell linker [Dissostichus eleginoides]|uniref:Cytokine-dependent hematopoietic cell linker n=1 Tax=Dissostichus eleginoides TaxID=100907 RepID=A0AAD9CNX3_DISEL|nr:Cytokine-dependent hematopoietic cell linker [Dissostichus eleginoides]